jgi:hypothetical protein
VNSKENIVDFGSFNVICFTLLEIIVTNEIVNKKNRLNWYTFLLGLILIDYFCDTLLKQINFQYEHSRISRKRNIS